MERVYSREENRIDRLNSFKSRYKQRNSFTSDANFPRYFKATKNSSATLKRKTVFVAKNEKRVINLKQDNLVEEKYEVATTLKESNSGNSSSINSIIVVDSDSGRPSTELEEETKFEKQTEDPIKEEELSDEDYPDIHLEIFNEIDRNNVEELAHIPNDLKLEYLENNSLRSKHFVGFNSWETLP